VPARGAGENAVEVLIIRAVGRDERRGDCDQAQQGDDEQPDSRQPMPRYRQQQRGKGTAHAGRCDKSRRGQLGHRSRPPTPVIAPSRADRGSRRGCRRGD
jgi:hypothetical protein